MNVSKMLSPHLVYKTSSDTCKVCMLHRATRGEFTVKQVRKAPGSRPHPPSVILQ